MTAKEFVDLYQYKEVRINARGRALWPEKTARIMIVKDYYQGFVRCQKKDSSDTYKYSYDAIYLEVIESEIVINFSNNSYSCPKCKKNECNGMERLECLTR